MTEEDDAHSEASAVVARKGRREADEGETVPVPQRWRSVTVTEPVHGALRAAAEERETTSSVRARLNEPGGKLKRPSGRFSREVTATTVPTAASTEEDSDLAARAEAEVQVVVPAVPEPPRDALIDISGNRAPSTVTLIEPVAAELVETIAETRVTSREKARVFVDCWDQEVRATGQVPRAETDAQATGSFSLIAESENQREATAEVPNKSARGEESARPALKPIKVT